MDGPDILIPVKPLDQGKSRLSGVLGPEQRQALCLHLFRQTLARAVTLADARPIVVSSDPLVRRIADAAGVCGLWTPRPGLSAALEDARATFADSDRPWLVLPCDLVEATSERLRCWLWRRDTSTLVPDLAGTGTNLLFLRRADRDRLGLAYGLDSRAAHQRAAWQAGIRLQVETPHWARRDLDHAEDLASYCPETVLPDCAAGLSGRGSAPVGRQPSSYR